MKSASGWTQTTPSARPPAMWHERSTRTAASRTTSSDVSGSMCCTPVSATWSRTCRIRACHRHGSSWPRRDRMSPTSWPTCLPGQGRLRWLWSLSPWSWSSAMTANGTNWADYSRALLVPRPAARTTRSSVEPGWPARVAAAVVEPVVLVVEPTNRRTVDGSHRWARKTRVDHRPHDPAPLPGARSRH